ncbi:XAC2610-related protein [Oceanivirga salmonicida]|uniref:XAC2610-related protein n=1 Tax=Oceanivirga salmonicida TaxID=1769291 RepID=UPI0012E31A20|nr:hypothetical protein [Oceanivirga salmonicida]
MKKFLIYLIMTMPLFSKPVTKILDFSDEYKALINIVEKEKSDENSFDIWIVDKKTNKKIIKTQAIIYSNYDFSNFIIYKDFNFDGKKDLAIINTGNVSNDDNGYKIYLKIKDKFEYNAPLTALTEDYLHMFEVDYKKKRLYINNSRSFYHAYKYFELKNNKPQLVEYFYSEILGRLGVVEFIQTSKKVGNRLVEKEYTAFIDKSDLKNLYKLKFKNGKEMNLYKYENYNNENSLIYAFENDDKIELYYDENFYYDKDKKTLSFTNDNIKYEIYNGGIIITKGKKKVNIEAIRKNDKDLNIDLNLENVYKK